MRPDPSPPSRRTDGTPTRRRFLQTLGVAGVSSLAGCNAFADDPAFTPIEPPDGTWPRDGYGPRNTARNPTARGPRSSPTPRWTTDTDLIVESVVVDESMVFVSGNGRLAALDRATGRVRWQIEAISNVLHIGNGRLFVGGTSMIQAIDPATGGDVWERNHRRMDTVSLLRLERGLLVGGYGYVRLHDPDTGELEWRVESDGSNRTELAAANGALFATSGGRFLTFRPRRFPDTAFHEGPAQALSQQMESSYLLGTTLVSGTAFLGGFSLGDANVRLESIALDTGQSSIHPIEAARITVPTVLDDNLMLAISSSERESPQTGAVLGYDPASKKTLWRYGLDDGGVPARPITDGRTVYVGGHGGPNGAGPTSVVALDAATGSRLWERDFDHETSALAVVGETLFVGTGNGVVTALRAG